MANNASSDSNANSANNTTMTNPKALKGLMALPRELRDKILFHALPDAYALPISRDPADTRKVTPVGLYPKAPYPLNTSSEHTYRPIPLLAISRQLRAESLSTLSRQTPLEVCNLGAFSAILDTPKNPDGTPLRNFHLSIFSAASDCARARLVPSRFHSSHPCLMHSLLWLDADEMGMTFFDHWLALLERLPRNTDTVTLDFSHPAEWANRRCVLQPVLAFVQRGSAKLWRRTKGRVTVNVVGWGQTDEEDSTTVLERAIVCPGRKKEKREKEKEDLGGGGQNYWSVLSNLEVEGEDTTHLTYPDTSARVTYVLVRE
ncbi:hypothetical protein BU16DRAFT_621187 [Lophium mytilinum]|uniref:F-box domain-containing protein n=1 Tax=Lophium mytilinum TaxID=390894 RepID=A0A6A6QI21_9PEZI|nr:hypothetical protein BU16DRAFT_621187 [Lophium mytilinum]